MNQIFIFLLIPISAAFSHLYISRYYNKNFLKYFTLAIFIFSTGKYHIRFNENKKFMELINVDFNLALDAKKIDKSLSGLKWITPAYKENPSKEIKCSFINKSQETNTINIYKCTDNRAIVDVVFVAKYRIISNYGRRQLLYEQFY